MGEYRQRKPREKPLWKVVQGKLEELKQVWEERFERRYGPWRPHAEKQLLDFIRCHDPREGFARIECPDCDYKILRPFSCQRKICPSCGQKRSLLFGEWIMEEVIPQGIGHALWTFTIPRALRYLFLRERKLLSEIMRSAWKSLLRAHQAALPKTRPGAIFALQAHGGFLQWTPHLHVLCTRGGFSEDGTFQDLDLDPKVVEKLFRKLLIETLLKKERISKEFAGRLLKMEPSGFSVHVGAKVKGEECERMGRYMTRSPVREKDLSISEDLSTVPYRGEFNPAMKRNFEALDSLEWLAKVVSQIPDRHEKALTYTGWYSVRSRARRRKTGPAPLKEAIPLSKKERKKAWARLLKKAFGVDRKSVQNAGRA